MNVSFAFSGPCNAGKTTLMHKIRERFGSDIHIVGECIRERIASIDAVRNNTTDYFRLQQEVIEQKIRQEDEALQNKKGKLILIDRSLADSLFYLTFYVDIKDLSPSLKEEYARFVRYLTDVARTRKRYDIIFMMQPLPVKVKDVMRPTDLAVTQTIEHQIIETLNIGLFTGLSKLTKVDVRAEEKQIIEACEEALSELR
jgi:predicted ATPase